MYYARVLKDDLVKLIHSFKLPLSLMVFMNPPKEIIINILRFSEEERGIGKLIFIKLAIFG